MFFCALSYVERTFSFNDEQMIKFVGEAVASCGIETNVEEVIRDFRESISIMERVGLLYEFAHRSFQEYFYAKFVTVDRKLSLDEKIGWLTDSFRSDDTVEMIADMDRIYFEDEFLLPNVERLMKKLSNVDPTVNPAGVLSKFFSRAYASTTRNRNEDENERTIYYTHCENSAAFFMNQAMWKYYDEYSKELEALSPEREMDRKSVVAMLDEEFGGEIKIHYSNNTKLLKIEANCFAERIKYGISCLHEHLLKKQEKRKNGLAALIKRKYS